MKCWHCETEFDPEDLLLKDKYCPSCGITQNPRNPRLKPKNYPLPQKALPFKNFRVSPNMTTSAQEDQT